MLGFVLLCRWDQEQQLYSKVLRPLLRWQQQQQQLATGNNTGTGAVSPRKQYSSSSSPGRSCHGSALSDGMLLAAAAAVEQLLLRDADKATAVAEVRQEMCAEQQQLEQQLQARAAQLEQELQVCWLDPLSCTSAMRRSSHAMCGTLWLLGCEVCRCMCRHSSCA
jgi:hypothetical protein